MRVRRRYGQWPETIKKYLGELAYGRLTVRAKRRDSPAVRPWYQEWNCKGGNCNIVTSSEFPSSQGTNQGWLGRGKK